MATQPSDGTNASADANEPEPIRKFRGHGWFNVWGLLLLAFLGLLGTCAYWIVRLGFGDALDNRFGYAAFLAVILGVCLIGRWSIPYLLLTAPSIDPRNPDAMKMPRSGWFFRGSFRRKR